MLESRQCQAEEQKLNLDSRLSRGEPARPAFPTGLGLRSVPPIFNCSPLCGKPLGSQA